MGAWGVADFENDSALDFFCELEEDPSLLTRTLDAAAAMSSDLDSDDAVILLACTALVAGKLDPNFELPEEQAEWIKKNVTVTPELVSAARNAVEVATAPGSELVELWDESDSDGEWTAHCAKLKTALQSA